MSNADFLDIVRERGFVKQVSDESGLRIALTRHITLYCGYDPTADSLTVGHLLSIMLLRHAQAASHRPICIVGGATGMIGDPTGKAAARPALTAEQVAHNLAAQQAQLARFLDFSEGRALILNNADWLQPLTLLDFLRQVGRHFSVSQMLAAETYESRLGAGLTFTEFSYMLLQAFDFLHLSRTYGCVLQVGGSDQWANSLAGVDLIRRVTGSEAYVLVTPLLTTASGAKMGKTAQGAVWLDPARTSPYAFYQYWINTEDADVERFLGLFTLVPMDEVRRLGALRGVDLRLAKQTLAFEVTRLVHGQGEAEVARATSEALFGAGQATGAVPTTTLSAATLARSLTTTDLLVLTSLCPSRSAARRLIAQGGATINGQRVTDADARVTAAHFADGDGSVLVRAGKKRFHRLTLAATVV
jgi:tyrosyl-tRNA synthetase